MTDTSASQVRDGALEYLANVVCRRAFSSPEAWLYERTIAGALSNTLATVFEREIVGPKVLDVGAGGGRLAALLVERRAVEVVAIEPSMSQIRRIRRLARSTPRLEAQIGSAEKLPFDGGLFDSVISSCAWKHWPDPAVGIKECLRVLRPDGRLVVVEVDGTSTAAEFWEFAKTSGVPFGMKRAYLRFAMRTVVGVAPGPGELRASFGVHPVEVTRLDGIPFVMATARG